MAGHVNFRRGIALVTMIAMIGGPAAPLSSKPAPPAVDASRYNPVHCLRSDDDYPRPVPVRPRRGRNAATRDNRDTTVTSEVMAQPAPPPLPPSAPPPPTGKVAVPQVSGAIAPYPIPAPQPTEPDRERYSGRDVANIMAVSENPVSTFSVDVDTGSYANVRRFLSQGQMPPTAAVRTEEMLNYFRYDYPVPSDRSKPFSLHTDMAITPWNRDTRLLRIGIRGYDIPRASRPPVNLVFLVDVSGSMMSPDKLPLVKTSLAMLANRMGPRDKMSIVVYAGAAGIVLDPTNDPRAVTAALDCLQAGGSTAGGQGMELAYATARAHFVRGGVNRVIMATDGDFNVGISSQEGIEDIVRRNRESGITLTTLGYGQGNYNEAMMERVADIGNGNYAYIDSAIEAQKVLDDEMAATVFTIAKDVKIQIEFNPTAVKEYRLIGYENRLLAEQDFNNDRVDAGDIGSGHQVTALYEIVPTSGRGWLPERRYEANRVAVPASGPASELAWLKLRYKLPDGDRSTLIEQPVPVTMMRGAQGARGDLAFAAAVAAFGQRLRGDKYLGSFNYTDISRLAGDQRGYLREEFARLVMLANARWPGLPTQTDSRE